VTCRETGLRLRMALPLTYTRALHGPQGCGEVAFESEKTNCSCQRCGALAVAKAVVCLSSCSSHRQARAQVVIETVGDFRD